jgi:hypothetical protein
VVPVGRVSPYAVLAIAIALVVVLFWALAEVDRWHRARGRERGLRRIYDEAQAEVDENAGVDRLRDRRPW